MEAIVAPHLGLAGQPGESFHEPLVIGVEVSVHDEKRSRPDPGARYTSSKSRHDLRRELPDGTEATTPVVPVVVGEDYQAALLWKALFDAGVYTNVAVHPAVPPGSALLRTSLMATHERDHLDRALGIIGRVTADFPDLPRT